MLVAAAVLPHPPLLIPPVASGAAAELDELRGACRLALAQMLAADPDEVVLVGAGPRTERFPASASGSLRPYGLDVAVPLGDGASGPPVLPLSLTVGAWLLQQTGWAGARSAQSVAADASPAECLDLGRSLADAESSVGLVVMGDGSARRSLAAPGYLDPRAVPFDDEVRRAIATADAAALAGLDPALAAELLVAGRPAWQVLAGAVGDEAFDAELVASVDPYGVAYHVAVWTRHG